MSDLEKEFNDKLSEVLNNFILERKDNLANYFFDKYKKEILKELNKTGKAIIEYYFHQHKQDIDNRISNIIQRSVDDKYGLIMTENVEKILDSEKTINLIVDTIDNLLNGGLEKVITKSIRKRIDDALRAKKVKFNFDD